MQTLTWTVGDRVVEFSPTWAQARERKVSTWEKADQALRSIAKRRAALDAEEAEWLVRARDAQVHKHLGLATFIAYMERVLGYGPKAAQERLRVAEALAALPRMRKAMAQGLSFSAVRELSRVATSDTEAEWLDATDGKCLREIESMVSGRKPGDRPDAPADPALIPHLLHFEVSAETHAMFREAIRRIREEAGRHLSEDEVLGQMAGAVLGKGGEGAPYQVAVTVCAGCKKIEMDGGGTPIEVGPEVLEMALCDGVELGRIDGDECQRAHSSIPPAKRRRVMQRDQRCCVVPWCRSKINVHVHHIQFRSEGGGHEMTNLAVLCGACHRRLHSGALEISGEAPFGLTFKGAEGRWTGKPRVEAPRVFRDAASALVNLGFPATAAKAAVEAARAHVGAAPAVEALVREALRQIRGAQA